MTTLLRVALPPVLSAIALLAQDSPADLTPVLPPTEIVAGVTYEEWERDAPLKVHVLRIDLSNPDLSLEAIPGRDDLTRRETARSVLARSAGEGRVAVAATNGDLGGRGNSPVSMLVRRGELLVSPTVRSAFVLDGDRRPSIGVFSTAFALRPRHREGPTFAPAFLNHRWQFEGCALFSAHWGRSPGHDGAIDVLLAIEDGRVTPAGTVTLKVVRTVAEDGGTAIPEGHLCLQARPPADGEAADLAPFAPGTEWTLTTTTTPAIGKGGWDLALGGIPRLVEDGRVDVHDEGARESFVTARHPRTGLGISKDRRSLVLVVIDGRRKGYSIGVTLRQFAAILKGLGAHDAMNLDGGGSSTMVVAGEVCNRPSDLTGERAVSSTLVLTTAEEGATPRRPRDG